MHPKARSYTPAIAVTAPAVVLAAALGASILMHLAMGLAIYNRPIGHIDPASLSQTTGPVRVRRAMYDQYVGVGSAGQGELREKPATAEQVSAAMLKQPDTPQPETSTEIKPDMRPIQDQRVDSQAQALLDRATAFELPEDELAKAARAPREMEYKPGVGLDTGEGDRAGAGDGSAGDGPGGDSGSGQALQLLGQAGTTGESAGPGEGGGGGDLGGRDRAPAPVPEQADMGVPRSTAPIDFAGVALKQTTQINVPEHLDNDFDYTVTRYDGPNSNQPGYFRVDITAQRSLRKLQTMPKDVTFLLDTSSSLPPHWVNAAAQGVRQSLASLNDDDRFNIVLFNQNPTALSTQGVQPVNDQTLAAARRFLSGARPRGFTDVNAAMRRLLVRDTDPGRVYELVLISDGEPTRGVMDTRELINLITRDNDLTASIYCVGIGDRQNRVLLNFLAYRNKGLAVYADSPAGATRTLRDLMSRLRYPLISNVSVGVAGVKSASVYPKNLPNIHQGETFSVFGRFNAPTPFTMRMTGLSGGKPVDFTFTQNLIKAQLGDKQLAHDWAFWKLHQLYSQMLRGDKDQQARFREQIDQLQKQYGLKTLY